MKKIRLDKISNTSGNGNPTNFLYFLKIKLFLYFRKRKTSKNSLCFRKQNFLKFAQKSSPNSEEMNVQNPDITKLFLYFKKGILRTLT